MMVCAFVMINILLFIFPYLDFFRNSTVDKNFDSPTSKLLYKGDYDAFEELVRMCSLVELRGVDYGRQTLGAVRFFRTATDMAG